MFMASDGDAAPMPSLIVPFAIVGLAAGWLSGRAANGPLFRLVVVDSVPERAAICCAITGGIVGAMLQRQCRQELRPTLARSRLCGLPMPLLLSIAGAVSAMLIGSQITYSRSYESAAMGVLFSLAFMPVCAFVLTATKRAARARHGSIVASADRRAVWSVLATTLGFTTLMALPEWSSQLFLQYSGAPWVAIAIAGVTAAIVLLGFALDLAAWWRLGRRLHEARSMEERPPEELDNHQQLPSFDLGLGEDLRAKVAHSSDYRRAATRVTALLRGNETRARRAIRSTLARSAISALLSAAWLGAHYVAANWTIAS